VVPDPKAPATWKSVSFTGSSPIRSKAYPITALPGIARTDRVERLRSHFGLTTFLQDIDVLRVRYAPSQ
jgi:hypothetical protein